MISLSGKQPIVSDGSHGDSWDVLGCDVFLKRETCLRIVCPQGSRRKGNA